MTVPYWTDFTILKFSFFQRLIVIELLVSETIEKTNYQNHFLLKLSSFLLFLFADSKSLQKQTREDVLKNGC